MKKPHITFLRGPKAIFEYAEKHPRLDLVFVYGSRIHGVHKRVIVHYKEPE